MEIIQFDLTNPIDTQTGIRNIGDEDTFYTIMEGFDDMTLIKNLTNMKENIETQDFAKFRSEAHSLKGASGYLAAGRVHQLSEKIQKAVDTKNNTLAFSLYPQLIEQSIILRLYIKKLLCQRKNIPYNEIQSDYEVPIANGYRIKHANDKITVENTQSEEKAVEISKPPVEVATPPKSGNNKSEMDHLKSVEEVKNDIDDKAKLNKINSNGVEIVTGEPQVVNIRCQHCMSSCTVY